MTHVNASGRAFVHSRGIIHRAWRASCSPRPIVNGMIATLLDERNGVLVFHHMLSAEACHG